METRNITVILSKSQSKKTISSAATTLGELKVDLDNANIDYSNCTFFEGLTKTELKTDDSILPTNVMYKGTETNELVFMLSTSEKKIKSGMSLRDEVVSSIKEQGLESAVKEMYGKNYTNCKTSDLQLLLESVNVKEVTAENTVENTPTESVSNNTIPNVSETISRDNMKNAILKLLDSLEGKYDGDGILLLNMKYLQDLKDVLTDDGSENTVTTTKSSSYSSKEIDSMFDFV